MMVKKIVKILKDGEKFDDSKLSILLYADNIVLLPEFINRAEKHAKNN